MAARFGVHRSTVYAWVRASGGTVRTPSEAGRLAPHPSGRRKQPDPRAIQAYADGLGSVAAAKMAKVSPQTLTTWLREAGVPVRRPGTRPLTPKQERSVQAYLEGSSPIALARKHGVTRNTVLNWVRRSGHAVRPGRPGPSAAPLTVEQRRAVKAYIAGASANRISAVHGVSPNTVLGWVRKAGADVRPRHPRGEGRTPHPEAARLRTSVNRAGKGRRGGRRKRRR